MKDNELEHIGVLGMRWGRRKGSSDTPISSHDHTTSSAIRKKKLSEMSNDEIKTLTARIKLENEYKSLNPGKVAHGQKKVADILRSTQQAMILGGIAITALKTAPKVAKFVAGVVAKSKR